MRYLAIYATTFCFGTDGVGIAAVIGTVASVFGTQLIMAQHLYWNSSQIILSTILYPLSASFLIFGELKH